jgi:hypothetical protein
MFMRCSLRSGWGSSGQVLPTMSFSSLEQFHRCQDRTRQKGMAMVLSQILERRWFPGGYHSH